jgi:RNA polymerase sigma factor (sigma-70 family)
MPYSTAEVQVAEVSFDDFFCREFNNVVRQVFYVLGEGDSAIEVAQEAFIRLYQKWPKVSRYEVPFAWVRKVAIRIAVKNRLRRYRELSVDELPEVPSESIPDSSYFDVRRAVMELPRAQKAAVMLYYFEDLPLEDVAQVIGCRKGTVKTHLARARTHLASVLKDNEEVA